MAITLNNSNNRLNIVTHSPTPVGLYGFKSGNFKPTAAGLWRGCGGHGACHRARIRATRWLENALQ
jgi:hypothetical protein